MSRTACIASLSRFIRVKLAAKKCTANIRKCLQFLAGSKIFKFNKFSSSMPKMI